MRIIHSETLQRYLLAASREARRLGVPFLTADIAFTGIVKDRASHAAHILGKLLKEWEIYQIRTRIESEIAKNARKGGNAVNRTSPDKPFGEIAAGLETVCACSDANESVQANTGHFLTWLMMSRESVSSQMLGVYGVTCEKIAECLKQLPVNEDYYADINTLERLANTDKSSFKHGDSANEQDEDFYSTQQATRTRSRKKSKSVIEQFGINLTRSARSGEIDPVVGREDEIERLIQILGRRKKNNPILVGEAGVGKSAIVEGLALRMTGNSVPASLRGKEIFSLDMASLVAGTKYRGQFEERLKSLIDELSSNRNIILFIDEIHTIVGAGSTQGSLDTANMLKPALARGEVQCVGTTTLDEYREHIESDGALERRFQKIIVEPATREQTLTILKNIKADYELHHGVLYTDEAVKACVELTERYMADRNFPDKAIDVMDEAGSKACLFGRQEPEILRSLEQSLAEAERERREALALMSYSRAAEARKKVLGIKSRIAECRSVWEKESAGNAFVIDAAHIAKVITSMTGIPVERISQDEKKRLVNMDEYLSGRVIGQDEAVCKVTGSIRRSRAGLKDPNKPIGVFMFVGPTGVGKTHLTKELSRWMFDRDDAIIRIDMSEYSEKHNVSRMIGSPPGYVGYGEGGQLTEAVRRQPYAVVLFDEIEKAHPDVYNIMLQIFDEGRLTDGLGRKVDFRNTIIIMTSNAGSREAAKKPNAVGYLSANKGNIVLAGRADNYRRAIEETFAPEFLNRIDDIVVFNTLKAEDVGRIVDLELRGLLDRAEKLGFKMKVTPKARKLLADKGYEPRYGVRSLKRTILDSVEEPLAQMIVSGEINAGDTVKVECRAGTIEVMRKAS